MGVESFTGPESYIPPAIAETPTGERVMAHGECVGCKRVGTQDCEGEETAFRYRKPGEEEVEEAFRVCAHGYWYFVFHKD